MRIGCCGACTQPFHLLLSQVTNEGSIDIVYRQEEKSPEAACAALSSLYEQYFEQRRHPASVDTLVAACMTAGIGAHDAMCLTKDEEKGLRETKEKVREQVENGVDSVPYVVFEGWKRYVRSFTVYMG
jgi:predicted DsbA family dithiol-disulfide isomerase